MAKALVEVRDGEALRQALKSAGMSYAALAARVGVTYQRIGQLCAPPRVAASTAAKIETALGVPRGTLFAALPGAELYGGDDEGATGAVRDA